MLSEADLLIVGRAALAAALGFVIGWERQAAGGAIRARTIALAALTAATLTALGRELFATGTDRIVQGIVTSGAAGGAWSESMGHQDKETLTFLDDDIARFMEESLARRGKPGPEPARDAGFYETAFRVLGRYMDEQKPRDVFFFEQDGAFVVRLLMGGQQGNKHTLAEFTRDDIAEMVARGPTLRQPDPTPKPTPAG